MTKVEWVRLLPCYICFKPGSDAHHVKTRGAGGNDSHLVPLCRTHHSEFHQIGRYTFDERHGVDLLEVAAYLEDYWRDSRDSF